MALCKTVPWKATALAGLVATLAAGGTEPAYVNNAVVMKLATVELNIYGEYDGTIAVSGTSELEWSHWYYSRPAHLMDMQMVSLDLARCFQPLAQPRNHGVMP